jgi:hypothetical protein
MTRKVRLSDRYNPSKTIHDMNLENAPHKIAQYTALRGKPQFPVQQCTGKEASQSRANAA